MITQIILRFEDLPEKDRTEICHFLLSKDYQSEYKYKVFYKQGGINKPMIEVKKGWQIMSECKKYFRQKKGAWIWIYDHETRRNKKICLQDLLDKINHSLRIENKTYFATQYDRDIFKQDCN